MWRLVYHGTQETGILLAQVPVDSSLVASIKRTSKSHETAIRAVRALRRAHHWPSDKLLLTMTDIFRSVGYERLAT